MNVKGQASLNSSLGIPHSSFSVVADGLDGAGHEGLFAEREFGVRRYLVDDAARGERVERPCEVLRGYAVHRRAHAEVWREQSYVLVGVLLYQAVDEVDLRADRPRGARGRFLNRLDDELRRAVQVGLLDDGALALRVHEHPYARYFLPHLIDVPGAEAAVHGAVALPQNQARAS